MNQSVGCVLLTAQKKYIIPDGANSPIVTTFLVARIQVSERKSTTVGELSVGGVVKAGTHGYLLVLHILNFSCVFLRYQINFN